MAVAIQTPGVHHVALRSSDLDRAKQFYLNTLGFPLALEADGIFLFMAGSTAIGVRGPADGSAPDDRFDPFRVGLDHVALACTDENELARVAAALDDAGVENRGRAR